MGLLDSTARAIGRMYESKPEPISSTGTSGAGGSSGITPNSTSSSGRSTAIGADGKMTDAWLADPLGVKAAAAKSAKETETFRKVAQGDPDKASQIKYIPKGERMTYVEALEKALEQGEVEVEGVKYTEVETLPNNNTHVRLIAKDGTHKTYVIAYLMTKFESTKHIGKSDPGKTGETAKS